MSFSLKKLIRFVVKRMRYLKLSLYFELSFNAFKRWNVFLKKKNNIKALKSNYGFGPKNIFTQIRSAYFE